MIPAVSAPAVTINPRIASRMVSATNRGVVLIVLVELIVVGWEVVFDLRIEVQFIVIGGLLEGSAVLPLGRLVVEQGKVYSLPYQFIVVHPAVFFIKAAVRASASLEGQHASGPIGESRRSGEVVLLFLRGRI